VSVLHSMWGDDVLDPLQFILLTYAVLLAGEEPADRCMGSGVALAPAWGSSSQDWRAYLM